MKFWIASYPRSGNSFIRTVLADAFGMRTGSIYPDEEAEMERRPKIAELLGYRNGLLSMPDGDRPVGIKTHDAPPDDAPAIYVVRDGRSALVSYLHFLKAFAPSDELSLPWLIEGKQWPGSWSDHFRSWDPLNRPNTLLLRYEDLRADAKGTCDKISEFFGVPLVAEPPDRLPTLRAIDPDIFRESNNAKNLSEMSEYTELFDSYHRDLMETCGYYTKAAP